MIRISQLKLKVGHTREQLFEEIIHQAHGKRPVSWQIVRKSVDARKKPQLFYVYTIDAEFENEKKLLSAKKSKWTRSTVVKYRFPYNKKDGYLMGSKAIPSDDDIETMENANRMNLVTMGLACNWMPKSIDEIRNFRIYGDYPTIGNDGFEDLIITVKNGSMDMEFFTMDYIGNNKFLLRTKSVLSQSNVLNQKYIDIKANKETLVRKLFKNKNN